jgi:hypothetical protein
VSSNWLGQTHPIALLAEAKMDSRAGSAFGFSGQMIHVPGISNFQGWPLHLQAPLTALGIAYSRIVYRDPDPATVSPGFPLKSQWKPLEFHNSCILHAYKTKTMWRVPQGAAVARPTWLQWPLSASVSEHGALHPRGAIPRALHQQGALDVLSKHPLKQVYTFIPWSL